MSRLRLLTSQILDLFFPPRCVVCKRRGAWFCARCARQISTISQPFCQRCGQGTDGSALCITCQTRLPALDGLRAVAYLEGPLRDAVHAFKYTGMRQLAQPLGRILVEGYHRYGLSADLIIPVPLHPARYGQRGFNQSLLLAEELATASRIPLDGTHLLRRRDTPTQVGLGAVARRRNVQGAFAWQGERLQGRRVLLVDDVCTTGATMEACAAVLYAAGAASVWGLALARERWQG